MAFWEFKIEVTDPAKRDIAIALLMNIGMSGFEEAGSVLLGFSTTELDEVELNKVIEDLGITYSKSIVEEKNWNAIWESEFEPISVMAEDSDNVFAYVRAHFHKAPFNANYDLVITPKMSFGTGHHATTYGMMSYMSRINFTGLKVIDFGTGTGVLAILAEKMGAESIIAIDNDPWCIRNAEENMQVNTCKCVELRTSNQFGVIQQADVILANINLNIIKDNLAMIRNASHAQTIILLSGILLKDETDIISALHDHDITEIDIIKNDGWLIIAAKSGRLIDTLTTSS